MPESPPAGAGRSVTVDERSLLSDLLRDHDVLELLDRLLTATLEATRTTSVALMVPTPDGLQVLAASSETGRDLELLQLMTGEGPAFDCLGNRERVQAPDLAEMAERWPRFTPAAAAMGVTTITSLYMQVRGTPVGAFNLFGREPLSEEEMDRAQTLADIGVLALLQPADRQEEGARLTERLRRALDRRVVVEQAKGVLAEWLEVSPGEAGPLLLARSRRTGVLLSDLARRVVALQVDQDDFRPGG